MSSAQNIIKDTKPLNLFEEREKFFNDPSYNPQFKYARPFSTNELTVWGLPQEPFYRHARKMIEYWNEEGKDQMLVPETPLVTQTSAQQKVNDFNHNFPTATPITVNFTENTVARCNLTDKTLTIRLPIQYTESVFDDLLRHELETHYLRKLNHEAQQWPIFPDPVFRRTEEGLANLHTFVFRKEKLILKTYRTYVAAYLAQQCSFAEIFAELSSLGVRRDTAFLLALRVKRGLEDTSQPGGLTKDISYFEGTLQVWQWLMNPVHDPHDLYLGRISLDQISELKPQTKVTNLLYPTFYSDMKKYLENIKGIGQRNQFEQLLAQIIKREEAYVSTST